MTHSFTSPFIDSFKAFSGFVLIQGLMGYGLRYSPQR